MDFSEVVHTGPGTLAGRYLRMFWQPVCCSYELAAGRALPVRILGEDFTVYRGDSGVPYLVGPRCAHRGTQLSVGSIEGECYPLFLSWLEIRWLGTMRRAAGGRTIVRGKGPHPELSGERIHRTRSSRIWAKASRRRCRVIRDSKVPISPSTSPGCGASATTLTTSTTRLTASTCASCINGTATRWTITSCLAIRSFPSKSPSGASDATSNIPTARTLTFFFGMPNINFINGQVVDPVIKRADVIVFKVPVDDESHIHFEVRAIPLTGERGRAWIEERREMRAQAERDRPEFVRAILAGKLQLSDVDPNRVDFVMLEDEVAQTGQGAIAVRSNEHLGRSDRGVFLLRKIWERELGNLADGRPLKQWAYRPDMVPTYPSM